MTRLTPMRGCRASLAALALCSALSLPAQERAPVSDAATAQDEPIVLSEFTVQTTNDQGYASTNSLSATRANVALRDVPNAIVVLNEEFLKDRQMYNLRDVLLYAPGVSNNNAADDGERVRLRGLTMTVPQLDGFRTPGSRTQENADVERVELLKGSAGLLYGNTFNFAGLINRVTVTPKFRPHETLEFRYGSDDFKEVLFDFGGRVTDKVAHRTYLRVIDSDGIQDHTGTRRDSFINHLLWKVNDRLSVSTRLLVQHQEVSDYRARDFYVNNALVQEPRERNFYEGLWNIENVFAYLRVFVDYKINDAWTARAGVVHGSNFFKSTDITGESIVGSDLRRTLRTVDALNTNTFGRFDVIGKFSTGPADHSLLIGIEDGYDNNPQYQYDNALPSINVLNPVWGNLTRGPRTNVQRLHSITQVAAGYIQEQAFFFKRRLSLIGGIRFDDFQIINRNSVPAATAPNRVEVNGDKTTRRAGVVVRPIDPLSLYASYSEGFNPRTFLNRDSSYIPPATGETKELGFKTEFLGGRLRIDGDMYWQVLGNVLVNDPTNPSGPQLISGEQEYEGYELGATLALTDQWQLLAGAAHSEGRITSDTNPLNNGRKILTFPEENANLWTKYGWGDRTNGGTHHYVGVGLIYSGKYYTDNFQTRTIPAYTRVDLAFGFNVGKFDVDARIDNVGNKRYWDSGANAWLNVNPGRKAIVSVKYRF